MNKIHNYLHSLQTPNAFFNISYVLMMLMMVLLPFTTFFMWPIGILLIILWISEGNWREKWDNFKTNDGIPYGFFLLGICLIPPLGLLTSTNMAAAWSTVECYLWFFIAPIIFLTASPKIWRKEHFDTLFTLFSASVIVYMISLFIHGIYKTATTGDINYMHYYYFCYNSHHAYTALYFTFVYLLIFNHLLDNQHNMKKKHVIWLYVVELFLIVGVFCLYSRAGILAFLVMQLIWGLYAIKLKRPIWKYILAITVVVFGIIAALVVIFPTNRFTQEAITIRHKEDSDKPLDPRLIIWQASWDASVKNLPWGVGTGDGSETVMEQYHENGYWMERTKPLNAHNQFLSALLTNGIPGIILILFYFSAPLALAIKHRDIMLLSIFVLMLLNCLVECMFERRAGVDFFAIMIPLLILKVHVSDKSLTK